MTTDFYTNPDWEEDIQAFLSRTTLRGDVWPHLNNGPAGKAALGDGKHPVLAIGGITVANGRDNNPVGVMVNYRADALSAGNSRVILNVQPGALVVQYVANVLTYGGGTPATFDQSLAFAQPVYVDDSDDLAAGVTLSLSPLNDAGLANPLAGWAWRRQTQEPDTGFGGGRTDVYPITIPNSLSYVTICVMLKGCTN